MAPIEATIRRTARPSSRSGTTASPSAGSSASVVSGRLSGSAGAGFAGTVTSALRALSADGSPGASVRSNSSPSVIHGLRAVRLREVDESWTSPAAEQRQEAFELRRRHHQQRDLRSQAWPDPIRDAPRRPRYRQMPMGVFHRLQRRPGPAAPPTARGPEQHQAEHRPADAGAQHDAVADRRQDAPLGLTPPTVRTRRTAARLMFQLVAVRSSRYATGRVFAEADGEHGDLDRRELPRPSTSHDRWSRAPAG